MIFWFLAVAHLSSAGVSDLWGIIPFVSLNLRACILLNPNPTNYITIHFPQQPERSPGSLTSILLSGARDPKAPEPDG